MCILPSYDIDYCIAMAQRSSAKHKKKSLCEQSLLLVANIMKLSFVTISFGTTSVRSTLQAVEKNIGASSSAKVADQSKDLVVPESSSGQRSQESESSSKPRSYLMEPRKGNTSYVTTHEKEDIDNRAADFIRRTHEKIKKSTELNSAPKILPRKLPISGPNIVREVSLF